MSVRAPLCEADSREAKEGRIKDIEPTSDHKKAAERPKTPTRETEDVRESIENRIWDLVIDEYESRRRSPKSIMAVIHHANERLGQGDVNRDISQPDSMNYNITRHLDSIRRGSGSDDS